MQISKDEVEAYKSVEQRIIATAYYTRDTFAELTTDDFYFDNHKKLYRAMLDGVFDLELELNANKYSYDNEWFFLALQSSPSPCPHLIPDLIEQSEKRKRKKEILQELTDLSNPTISYKSDRNSACEFLTLDDIALDCNKAWENKTRIDLGRFHGLGKKIYSFDKGAVSFIAARPGVGKTAFSVQLVQEYSYILNEKFIFFSMEMDRKLHTERVAKTFFWMNEGHEPDVTREMSNEWFYQENKDPIFPRAMLDSMVPNMIMVDKKGLTTDDIRAYLKNAWRYFGAEVGTILIDYAQLIKGEGSEIEKQTNTARELQVIAGEFPEYRFVVLVQINRDGGKSVEPTMNDIKGSGAYEEVADEIMALWDPKKEGIDDLLMISHLKSRQNGATGRTYIKKYGLYYESPQEHDYNYWKTVW